MRGGLSLQERLMVLVTAAILPLSALTVWSAVRQMELAHQQARTQLASAASFLASLDLVKAEAVLGSIPRPAGAHLGILDWRGVVLMEYPTSLRGVPDGPWFDGRLLAAAHDMIAGIDEWSDLSGDSRIYAYAPSRGTPEGFLAVVSIERDQLMQAPLAALRRELMTLAVVLLAGLAAAWWVGNREVVKQASWMCACPCKVDRGETNSKG
jgi:hypothetical protein